MANSLVYYTAVVIHNTIIISIEHQPNKWLLNSLVYYTAVVIHNTIIISIEHQPNKWLLNSLVYYTAVVIHNTVIMSIWTLLFQSNCTDNVGPSAHLPTPEDMWICWNMWLCVGLCCEPTNGVLGQTSSNQS